MVTGESALRRRVAALLRSVEFLVGGVASLVLFVLQVVGVVLVVVWVGIPFTLAAGTAIRWVADRRRRLTGRVLDRTIESPYLQRPAGNLLGRFGAFLRDPATRRDARWVLVDGTLGLALAVVGLVEGILDLLFWWLPVSLSGRAHVQVDAALLSVSEKSRLALRVQQLTESRAVQVDASAAELRRIERDLHDGAQARLVSLGMSLALAEEQLARDPDATRTLLAEARDASSDALAELRDLVRGIHPPVLADRGLSGAVQALALATPLPVEVVDGLTGRSAAPLESALYFAVAESLTNVVKHADASRARVSLARVDDSIVVEVDDDGHGGADPARGSGLHGIARRLSAFDGTLTVTSPAGGPTRIVMVLPCASSSPRTSPSSGTA
ncbi:Histidine kinase [Jatrophihabitans endophyticus]|uniref:histidine kinase n=1 Tax=Jatrophihabitans endophyticus TaxID=1206085 RepID=A0A1M5L006_9ACTN|nr:sensor domain-containing protein [Jatrophihabitans endophyticus]SHG58250.1 Histidine kinase [Jatrophihabitans endophyticus]